MFKRIKEDLVLDGAGCADGSVSASNANEPVLLSQLIEGFHTPAYVYDLDAIIERYNFIRRSFQNKADIHFAVKSLNHPLVLKALAQAGCGADVVSGGE